MSNRQSLSTLIARPLICSVLVNLIIATGFANLVLRREAAQPSRAIAIEFGAMAPMAAVAKRPVTMKTVSRVSSATPQVTPKVLRSVLSAMPRFEHAAPMSRPLESPPASIHSAVLTLQPAYEMNTPERAAASAVAPAQVAGAPSSTRLSNPPDLGAGQATPRPAGLSTSTVGNESRGDSPTPHVATSPVSPVSAAASPQIAAAPMRHGESRAARILRKATPAYPEAARADGVEGTVVLNVSIDADGEVTGVDVVSSSGDKRLDMAAKRGVESWRYTPRVEDGAAVATTKRETVRFTLDEE